MLVEAVKTFKNHNTCRAFTYIMTTIRRKIIIMLVLQWCLRHFYQEVQHRWYKNKNVHWITLLYAITVMFEMNYNNNNFNNPVIVKFLDWNTTPQPTGLLQILTFRLVDYTPGVIYSYLDNHYTKTFLIITISLGLHYSQNDKWTVKNACSNCQQGMLV